MSEKMKTEVSEIELQAHNELINSDEKLKSLHNYLDAVPIDWDRRQLLADRYEELGESSFAPLQRYFVKKKLCPAKILILRGYGHEANITPGIEYEKERGEDPIAWLWFADHQSNWPGWRKTNSVDIFLYEYLKFSEFTTRVEAELALFKAAMAEKSWLKSFANRF